MKYHPSAGGRLPHGSARKLIALEDWAGWWSRPRQSPSEVRAFQERRLRWLVHHAYQRVAYYRRLLQDAGVPPERIRTLDDLARIPITTKPDLRRVSLQDRLADDVAPSKRLRSITSGSDGEPSVVIRTAGERNALQAHRLRAQILAGLRPLDLRVSITSHPAPRQRAHHRLGFFRQVEIDSRDDTASVLCRLEGLKPDVVRGQPQTLDRLARIAAQAGPTKLRPRLIFSGADTLTPAARRRIEAAFAAPVVDFYGSEEFDLIAWECRRCGLYHACDDSVIVEIVGDDGAPAGEGRVVATGLHSLAMPFLRFDLGDIARWYVRSLSCPVSFRSMEQPIGRRRDFLPLRGGRALSPSKVEAGLQEVEGLGRYQVVQTSLDRVIVYYEPLPGATPAGVAAAIERACPAIFPPELAFEVRLAAGAIPKSAKRRPVRTCLNGQ
ncbi:MAG: phenylacetate--CoA ligase family protein [Bryobacteraceae bacterium]|nr:phenylacetate--CoA ligase family protein [Bryobacteraceae bacterium]